MSQKTILIIDDSTTIRRLVDRGLTAAGFRVVAAENAEQGLRLLQEVRPDLILLDHQLPGTTGTEVCKQILQLPDVADTPVVVSSTLRNRAYAEYSELPNVVDMLPKPYTEDLLKTTVENGLETGKLVVQSQSQGTAVPEVIRQMGEPDLAGSFGNFRIREVLDFLNNANRTGVLEIEGDGYRVFFHLNNGRIAGVSANGLDAQQIADRLPEELQNLAPIVTLTVGSKTSNELNGIIELLNRQVVDPRLLRKVLRHQAALLTWRCFNDELKGFRFTQSSELPSLVRQLPLGSSVIALLIEGALRCDDRELPAHGSDHVYARSTPRGQNLDRAGVSVKHLKLLNAMTERRSAKQLSDTLEWSEEQTQRVLQAFVKAELVERHAAHDSRQIVVFDADATSAGCTREKLDGGETRFFGKVVRDRFALELILKRAEPEAIVFVISNADVYKTLCELAREPSEARSNARLIGAFPPGVNKQKILEQLVNLGLKFDAALDYSSNIDELFDSLDALFNQQNRNNQEIDIQVASEPAGDADMVSGIVAGIA